MDFGIIHSSSVQKQAIAEIQKCNEFTEEFGLSLTYNEAVCLLEARSAILKKNGRIEFGNGIIDKIIRSFYDSPYLSMEDYTETLQMLLELFYYYKNETFDLISDDDLIHYMSTYYNGSCHGSLELLAERELVRLSNNIHNGHAPDYKGDDND